MCIVVGHVRNEPTWKKWKRGSSSFETEKMWDEIFRRRVIIVWDARRMCAGVYLAADPGILIASKWQTKRLIRVGDHADRRIANCGCERGCDPVRSWPCEWLWCAWVGRGMRGNDRRSSMVVACSDAFFVDGWGWGCTVAFFSGE